MIYLDTHVVVWLYSGLTDKLTDIAKTLINDNEVYISAIVRLELQYLYEIKRIKDEPDVIISNLFDQIDLKICNKNFNDIISISLTITWTRDPFDRIITANALLNNNILLSKDQNILNNYLYAKWYD
ncbi:MULTISPECIES: type II toxin-antitoxin system VapC family toxin [unclassified Nostoc]|uniref:type II toxin-antitoxin system VapC family toxin n=1 Tax=unclassified Nostoc TaxID=2593658 RepID=UPI002AD22B06|nr:PIN domain-containing protein [Nostoc sp. DedQUE03]MDZ7973085.1 PIN domain-containing protein [Nostoc sp. DedQUE03]MDZ8042948.1 PIN domain-containing protein [Nostoc sp. DedQUE02]